jgi:hypothetical protein
MAESMIWGSFGDTVFEYLTSPQRGTVRRLYKAKYNERSRIISRQPDGSLKGQKPLKDVAGLALDKVSFTCKISGIVLKKLSINTAEALLLAAGAGPLVGSALGDLEDDTRFYTDVLSFIDTLKIDLSSQEPRELTKGTTFLGMFTLDDLDITETDKVDGEPLVATIKLSLTEWVPE